MSETLGTIRLPYRLFRAAVSSADTDLNASTKSWANFLTNHRPVSSSGGGSGAIAIKLEERDNKAIVCFDFATASSDTSAFIIYGYREGWSAEFICSVDTLTAGDQESAYTSTTRYFADTIGTITQRWLGGSSSVEEVDSGSNGIVKLKFDTYGIKYLLILHTTIGAGSVTSFISFY